MLCLNFYYINILLVKRLSLTVCFISQVVFRDRYFWRVGAGIRVSINVGPLLFKKGEEGRGGCVCVWGGKAYGEGKKGNMSWEQSVRRGRKEVEMGCGRQGERMGIPNFKKTR